MPRRNLTPKHTPYQPKSANSAVKKRFISRQSAQNAIKEIQKYDIDIKLSVYQSPEDGEWYLTSR